MSVTYLKLSNKEIHFEDITQRNFVTKTDKKIFDVNYFGIIALTKFVLAYIIKNGGGHLVVTTSIVGKFEFPYRSFYSASKFAFFMNSSTNSNNYFNNFFNIFF